MNPHAEGPQPKLETPGPMVAENNDTASYVISLFKYYFPLPDRYIRPRVHPLSLDIDTTTIPTS
jgi:hypothetical protein